MEKIIFDTDIGSDIDDAFALSYLLNQPQCQLMGITTVSGEADKRADLCQLFVDLSQKPVSVYEGVSRPIHFDELQPVCPQARVLNEFQPSRHAPYGEALNFMRRTILEHPHEITILSVAPFTNIGLLLASDPKLAPLIKRLIIMGCKVSNHPDNVGLLDWNVLCDPLAAQIMLEAEIPEVVIFPCDLTYKLRSTPEYLDAHVHGRYRDLIRKMAAVWFERFDGYSYHDPMAATYPFHPELVSGRRGTMKMDLSRSATLSYTWFEEAPEGRHFVAETIDDEAFLKELYAHINEETV